MHLLKNRVEPEISVRNVEIPEMVDCPKSSIRRGFRTQTDQGMFIL